MLVNHPLDCPICDAAGECDLQDTCYGLQVDKNKYTAELERLPIRYDWKLLESDPNRCILCEKCVKVCREIVGREAIEIVDRGDRTIIDTITGEPLDCDFCGNCINACPTGTLISKPFKFRGRPWTFEVTKSVCAFCSSGCQIEYHVGNGRVERVTSSDDSYNKGNLCVNGRFGYAAFNSPGRLTAPLIKDASGHQQKATWDQALAAVAGKLKEIVRPAAGLPWPVSVRRASPTRKATCSRNSCAVPSAPTISIPRHVSASSRPRSSSTRCSATAAAPIRWMPLKRPTAVIVIGS